MLRQVWNGTRVLGTELKRKRYKACTNSDIIYKCYSDTSDPCRAETYVTYSQASGPCLSLTIITLSMTLPPCREEGRWGHFISLASAAALLQETPFRRAYDLAYTKTHCTHAPHRHAWIPTGQTVPYQRHMDAYHYWCTPNNPIWTPTMTKAPQQTQMNANQCKCSPLLPLSQPTKQTCPLVNKHCHKPIPELR